MTTVLGRIAKKARRLRRIHAGCLSLARGLVEEKAGLEIGGPSEIFRHWYSLLPIYSQIKHLDNCDFAPSTHWATHSGSFHFSSKRDPGKTIFCDGSNLDVVADGSYDFVLSSHNLEHFANPVRALKEWQRVTRPGGALVLVLPYYRKTAEHKRTPTTVDHMMEDFERGVLEDDPTHVEEVFAKHDRSIQPVGTDAEFRENLLANYTNRMMHHHAFDEVNSRELLERVGMNVLSVELGEPHHVILLAQMPRP